MTPIDALAVARLVRLIGKDTITERPRVWVLMHAPRWMKAKTLLRCPWCLSVWLGFGWLAVRRLRWWRPMSEVLALSYVVGEMETLLVWLDVTREAAHEEELHTTGRVLYSDTGQELSTSE